MMMKFILCFSLVCAVAIAKPTNEADKSKESSASQIIKNETVPNNNHRVERDDQLSPLVQMSTESEQKDLKSDSDFDLNTPEGKPRLSYSSSINQENPSVQYSSRLNGNRNIDSSLPARSAVAENFYGSQGSYGSYGLGSGLYGSGSYGLGSGSYGYGLGSYGSLGSSGVASYSYPSVYNGLGSGPWGYSRSNVLSQAYGMSGPLQSYSSLPVSISSCSNSVPYHGGINIAQQIIHKPIVTELQEVIHKPIVTEIQEIVNKPIFSEFQQVIHKPLYTEHIGLVPSYHGYQKHIVKQPLYQTPSKQFVHQPMSHSGIIHLADKYEQAINTHSTCESGSGYSGYGYSGQSYPAVYGSGIGIVQPSELQYGSAFSVSHPVSYGQVYSTNVNTPVSAHYSPSIQTSESCSYDTIPSAHASYKSANPAVTSSAGTSTPNGYPTLSPNGYSMESNNGNGRPIAVPNAGNGGTYRSIEENVLPKSEEQVAYDQIAPYKPSANANQQYDNNQFQQQFSGYQQQRGSNSEDPTKTLKMDVDAISKQIEKNPEMRKQLIKIITESIYVSDQMTQANKKQKDQTAQSLIKLD